MTLFGLIWSNLFRKRTRTVLTLLSVAIAFLLFMLLRGVAGAFRDARLGLMDYYELQNVQADTKMRTAIAGVGDEVAPPATSRG